MKSHATATLVGAALLSAAAAVAQTPTTPGRAMKGTLIKTTVASTNVPAPVPITYYLPKNYDANRAERYPLLIQLHSGGGSNKDMEKFRAQTVGGGMGGMGSLRIAVKYPEGFQAVASQEPAIEPALAYDDITLRDKIGRPDGTGLQDRILLQRIYGDPIDKDYWAANHPTTIIKKDPSRLLGLGIYLEVGDQDLFYIDQGTEFVHRVLFDAGISHEYRLVKGADHVGASLVPRSLDAFAFIGRQLNPPKWIDDTALRFRAIADENKKARGYPVTPFDPNRIHAE